jgi:hypothetical protein
MVNARLPARDGLHPAIGDGVWRLLVLSVGLVMLVLGLRHEMKRPGPVPPQRQG